jgi:hypothetical protein
MFHVEHGKCNICKKEYTSTHTEVSPGVKLYACKTCLEIAKNNFIWVCMNCSRVYIYPKKVLLKRLKDKNLLLAYAQCEDMQIIQGLDMCVQCDPEGIFNYMDMQRIREC